jgi:hypothetical protein
VLLPKGGILKTVLLFESLISETAASFRVLQVPQRHPPRVQSARVRVPERYAQLISQTTTTACASSTTTRSNGCCTDSRAIRTLLWLRPPRLIRIRVTRSQVMSKIRWSRRFSTLFLKTTNRIKLINRHKVC